MVGFMDEFIFRAHTMRCKNIVLQMRFHSISLSLRSPHHSAPPRLSEDEEEKEQKRLRFSKYYWSMYLWGAPPVRSLRHRWSECRSQNDLFILLSDKENINMCMQTIVSSASQPPTPHSNRHLISSSRTPSTSGKIFQSHEIEFPSFGLRFLSGVSLLRRRNVI